MITIPAQLLSQLLPVDRLESQCTFRREWQPSSLLSIPSASAVMRISRVSSPVLQVPCPPDAVAGTGPQTGHSSACSLQTWEQGVTGGVSSSPEPKLGLPVPLGRRETKEYLRKMIVAYSALLLPSQLSKGPWNHLWCVANSQRCQGGAAALQERFHKEGDFGLTPRDLSWKQCQFGSWCHSSEAGCCFFTLCAVLHASISLPLWEFIAFWKTFFCSVGI